MKNVSCANLLATVGVSVLIGGCSTRENANGPAQDVTETEVSGDVTSSREGELISIKVGMDFSVAQAMLAKHGPQTEMAMSGEHVAYVLEDDLTVVIAGRPSLDTIIVVTGFGQGKAHRNYDYVENFSY